MRILADPVSTRRRPPHPQRSASRTARSATLRAMEPGGIESREEFDLALDQLDTEAFRALEHAGVVTVFDVGEKLAGVRLTPDPDRAKHEDLLHQAAAVADTPLARALRDRVGLLERSGP
jgi:hypothetical protein